MGKEHCEIWGAVRWSLPSRGGRCGRPAPKTGRGEQPVSPTGGGGRQVGWLVLATFGWEGLTHYAVEDDKNG